MKRDKKESVKKILIITNSFFPKVSPRSFRSTELAKELARQGHYVKVIGPAHADQKPLLEEYDIKFEDIGQITWKPLRVGSRGIMNKVSGAIARLASVYFEYPNIQLALKLKQILKHESGYDLLISIATPYPIHWGTAMVRKNKGDIARTWVADCGDPYMGNFIDTFRPPFYFKFLEKDFCRKADYITVPTDGSVSGYYPEFHHKIKIIPQGFRFEDIPLADNFHKNNKPTFAYGGMFIPGRRDPTKLLEYLTGLPNDFEFRIYTKTPNLVKPFLDRSGGRIRLFDAVPRNEFLLELQKMDFVVNFENPSTRQTPSKLIDYTIIGKPILSIATNDLKPEVVHAFLRGDYSGAFTVDNPDQYRIANVAAKFLSLDSDSIQ